MSFDSSRFTFNPRRNFLGVVMEQGRVQLDSDWNEWQAEFTRRIQAGTLDILGPSAYPINITPNAFAITASSGGSGGNVITIGAGRYYVDGLLAESHGPKTSEAWDPALAELSGAPYVQPFSDVTVNYLQQPYLPNPPAIAGNGPYLVYLDVWEREVTYLEDEWLIDKAVGVDTTGRIEVIWQVKLLDISGLGSGVTCATDVPAYDTLTAPSAARLTNGLFPNTPSGPCCLAANTGYTGLENQLYRVEIHTGGAKPTFKWSRDNASVGTNVTGITTVVNSGGTSVSQITVASLGRDSVLGFNNGDWIEITDDDQELAGLAGELHQIMATPAPGLTLTLDSEIALSLNPSDTTRHTRITRWDQKGTVQKVSGTTTTAYFDIDTSGASGIPVPTAAGTQLVLENGITVSFGLDPAGGPYYPGDFWTFAARTADGSIQPRADAPPSGIHHHYARLSVVTFPSTSSDCRVPWPPAATGGSSCCCTVNVSPSDLNANNSLQNIIDKFENLATTTEICLAQGTYFLNAPLRLTSAHTNIIIKACQAGTASLQAQAGQESQFYDGMIVLDGVTNITLSGLDFSLPIAMFAPTTFAGIAVTALDPDIAAVAQNLAVSIGVRPVNANSVTIESCIFDLTNLGNNLPTENSYPFGAGIFATGDCAGLQVTDNHFEGSGDFQTGFLLTPSVAFNPPTLTHYPGGGFTTDFPTKAGVLDTQQFAAELAKPAAAAKVAPKPAVAEEKAVTGTAQKIDTENLTYKAGSSVINKYQNILNEGTSTPNLAGAGGSVLPALLSQATFTGNTFSGLTVAVLILGQSEVIDFLSNQVSDCTAGFWMIAPTQAQVLLFDEENLTPLGSLIAMSYPLPQGDASSLVTVPPSPASVFLYPGANDDVDSLGDTWIPDSSTSSTFTLGGSSNVSRPVPPPSITEEGGAAEPDSALYQTERYGNSFSYTFNSLPVGYYQVTLKFAEIFWQSAGIRIFDVSINGAQVLTNFDIFADASGSYIADDKIFPNVLPSSGGQIVVQFTGTTNGNDSNAKISAIELDPQWSGNAYLGSGNEGELASFFDQLAQLAQQGYAPLWIVNPDIAREVEIVSPSHLRIQDNEMQGLAAPGLFLLGDDSDVNQNVSSLMMTGNRISSNISFQKDSLGGFLTGTRAGDSSLGDLEAEFLDLFFFLFTVTIVQVGQCLVSSNIVVSNELSFVLYDQLITAPQLSVMSNLFTGYMSLVPPAYPASPGVLAPAAVRGLLNTMVT